jgi:hypothetical protein
MLVEQFIPEAKKLINDKILALVQEKGAQVALRKVYDMFPFYVRALVKEDVFVAFCLKHQDKLFGTSVASKQTPKKSVKKVVPKKAPAKTVKKSAQKKL